MSERSISTPLPSAQTLTSLHYDSSLNLLSVGDLHGQVFLSTPHPDHLSLQSSFTSHTVSFDKDIIQHESDSIVALQALYSLPGSTCLLAANERVVKLWSVQGSLARCRRKFQAGHEFRIHSLSVAASKQAFLTCDDLTLNLWDVERTDCTYKAADHKPNSVKDLREVLLSAAFHHTDPAFLLTTSSAGSVRIADLRVKAKVTPPAIELRRPKGKDSQYSDIVCSVTSAAFALEPNLVFSRDFQSAYVWDMRQPVRPISCIRLTGDSRSIVEALNSQTGLGRFQLKEVPGGCVTGGFEGQLIAISSAGDKKEAFVASDQLPQVAAGPEATFTCSQAQVMYLPQWPAFTH